MKRPNTHTKNYDYKIIEAALKLAARKPWNALTLEEIVKAANVPVSHLKKTFSSPNDLLPHIARYVDNKAALTVGAINRASPISDRLFQVLMTRIDVLQNQRRAFLGIIDACFYDPSLFLILFKPLMSSMQQSFDLAKADKKGHSGTGKKLGLLAVYVATVLRWKYDISRDLSPTMASLNKWLLLCGDRHQKGQ